MGHTKRSNDFADQINMLCQKLESVSLTVEDRKRLCEILQVNTTDSPCVLKAKWDEPIFVLLARDIFSVSLVSDWAAKLRTYVANVQMSPEQQKKAMAKWADAVHCAKEMQEWPDRRHPD